MRPPVPFALLAYYERFPNSQDGGFSSFQVAAAATPPEQTVGTRFHWTVSMGPLTPINYEPNYRAVAWPDETMLFGFANAARLISFADHPNPLLIVIEQDPNIGNGYEAPHLALPGRWPRSLRELLDPRLTAAAAARNRIILGLGEHLVRLGGEPDYSTKDVDELGLAKRPKTSYGLTRSGIGDTLEIRIETLPHGWPPEGVPCKYFHTGLIIIPYPSQPITDPNLFYGRWLRCVMMDHIAIDRPLDEFRAWDPWTTCRGEPRHDRVHLIDPASGEIVASYQKGVRLPTKAVGEIRPGYGLSGFLAHYQKLIAVPQPA